MEPCARNDAGRNEQSNGAAPAPLFWVSGSPTEKAVPSGPAPHPQRPAFSPAHGKLTEGLTEFALKDGKFHSKVKLDALMPGKTASHQVYFSLNM